MHHLYLTYYAADSIKYSIKYYLAKRKYKKQKNLYEDWVKLNQDKLTINYIDKDILKKDIHKLFKIK